MGAPVHTIAVDDTLTQAKSAMIERQVSSLPVVENGSVVGIISRSDLLKAGRVEAGTHHQARLLSLPPRPVSEIMTREVVHVGPDDSVSEAASKMIESRVHRVLVMEGDELCGVFSPHDIVVAIADKRVQIPIKEFMSSPVFTVRASEPLSLATDRLAKAKISGLIVVDGEWPVGAFTQLEALRSKDDPRTTPVEEAMTSAVLRLEESIPLHRAAAQAATMDARRVVAASGSELTGILSGLDFARAVL
jgi:CBS domain-containing protein